MTFQPLSGPGWRVHKRGVSLEQLRAEIATRLAALPNGSKLAVPTIIPADRGRNTANWQIPSWDGLREDVREAIRGVMMEMDVEEPD